MRKIKNVLKRIPAVLLSAALLAGCTQTDPAAEAAAKEAAAKEAAEQKRLEEVNQNDYRGALTRIDSIRTNLLGVLDGFNQRNIAIEKDHASDFWTSEGYSYLSASLLNDDAWKYTYFFNELETTWEEAQKATKEQFEKTKADPADATEYWADNISIKHPETNHYTLNYAYETSLPFYTNGTYKFTTFQRIKYDANHDWASCTRWRNGNGLSINDGLLEYVRLSPTEFVIQTSTERLYVRYEDGLYDDTQEDVETLIEAEEGAASESAAEGAAEGEEKVEATPTPEAPKLTDPLGTKRIVEFYYSMLNGEPRYEYAEPNISEDNSYLPFWEVKTADFTYYKNIAGNEEQQEYVCVYNTYRDSVFDHMDELGKDWVFADNGRFKQCISFYDDMLVVKNENQLVDMLECTLFKADGTTESYDEDIYVPEIYVAKQDTEIVDGYNTAAEKEMAELFTLSTDGFAFGERISFENIIGNRNMKMLDLAGVKYDPMTTKDYEMDQFMRAISSNFELFDSGIVNNDYSIPAGRYYFVSTIGTDEEGNEISDNESNYTILTEGIVQDIYTIRCNRYFLKDDESDDCRVTLQNIKPRMTTRTQVESMLGYAKLLSYVEILDDEGFTQYTVSFPDDIAAYRCENGILYVHYNDENVVDIVGQYAFEEPQPLDNVYGYNASAEEADTDK